jgi:hypothetical protein
MARYTRIENAALEWWHSRCPTGWTLLQHLDQPTAGVADFKLQPLAREIAIRLQREHQVAIRAERNAKEAK